MIANDITGVVLLGLSRGMVYFIVAAGLTLVFGVLRVMNFAHGSFYMLGAFLSYFMVQRFALGNSTYGFLLVLMLVPLVTAALSLFIERGLLRFVYKRDHLMQVLLTYALVLIFSDLIKIIWGVGYRSISVPKMFVGSYALWGVVIPKFNFFLLAIGPVVAIVLWFFLRQTLLGKICRATATDRQMVDNLGVNSTLVFATVFAISGWLGGFGGALIAPVVNISLGMDQSLMLYAFIIVVAGGLGNVWGALLGSMIIGIGEGIGVLFLPNMSLVLPYLLIGLILIVRPRGLLKSVW